MNHSLWLDENIFKEFSYHFACKGEVCSPENRLICIFSQDRARWFGQAKKLMKGTDLVTREQIEAQITALEQIPEQQRTPGDTKRLQMLQDTRMFEGEYFIHVRNGKGGRERVSPIIGKNQTQIIDRMKNTLPEGPAHTEAGPFVKGHHHIDPGIRQKHRLHVHADWSH